MKNQITILLYYHIKYIDLMRKGTIVIYTYLADGTKVSALDASDNGLLYSGAMVFRKDSSVRSAESVGYSGGRFVADASGVLRPQIHVLDHLGSVRAIVDKGQPLQIQREGGAVRVRSPVP